MKKLLLVFSFLCFSLVTVAQATSVDKTIRTRQAQAEQMQRNSKQMEQDALDDKPIQSRKANLNKKTPPRRKSTVKKAEKKVSDKKETASASKKTSQTTENKDLLQITGIGDFAVPLATQQLAQDGRSGLAYQKTQKEVEQNETTQEEQQFETRRLKAVEKEYTLSGTTFDVELNKSVQVPQNESFQVSTMEQAIKDVGRENTRFVECQPGDKNCADYKVDNTGKVIW